VPGAEWEGEARPDEGEAEAMNWAELTAIGTVLSAFVFLAGAVIAIHELDHMARDRFVTTANSLLQIWESPTFRKRSCGFSTS
jgi:hypothetical protein